MPVAHLSLSNGVWIRETSLLFQPGPVHWTLPPLNRKGSIRISLFWDWEYVFLYMDGYPNTGKFEPTSPNIRQIWLTIVSQSPSSSTSNVQCGNGSRLIRIWDYNVWHFYFCLKSIDHLGYIFWEWWWNQSDRSDFQAAPNHDQQVSLCFVFSDALARQERILNLDFHTLKYFSSIW